MVSECHTTQHGNIIICTVNAYKHTSIKSACRSSSGGSWCTSCSGVSLLLWRRLKGYIKVVFEVFVLVFYISTWSKNTRTEVDLALCQPAPSVDQTVAKCNVTISPNTTSTVNTFLTIFLPYSSTLSLFLIRFFVVSSLAARSKTM